MWFPGASNSAGGVTVDLRGLNSVELSADKSSVFVGIGATWDAVYNKLDPLGLSVAGGRVAGVGVRPTSWLDMQSGHVFRGGAGGWIRGQS